MPIYEFYCPQNHRIYQFLARSLAQANSVPKCPDNPDFQMKRMLSAFAVAGRSAKSEGGQAAPESGLDERKMEAAMGAMEREFAGADENDPKAVGRMMRRMADLTGERLDGPMEAVVRRLEEGADPESLEEDLGGDLPDGEADRARDAGGRRRGRAPRGEPTRDPKLYEFL